MTADLTDLDTSANLAGYLTDAERLAFAELFSAYPDDDRLATDIRDELRGVRIRNAVRAMNSAEGYTPPPRWPGSVAEQLANGTPEIDWLVEGLMPNGMVQLNAQFKAGKTTFAINLVRSLLLGEAFLGRFPVVFDGAEHVGFINMELDKNMFLKWLEPMQLDETVRERLHVYHAREAEFGRPNLRHPKAFQYLVDWLIDCNITYLVIDPISALFMPNDWPASDINNSYLQFWDRLEELKRKSGLRGIFLTNHTGLSESAANRSRGCAAMMDKPDVNISYRHDGEMGQERAGNRNFMKPEGRIDAVDELELELSPKTKRLRVTGGGGKAETDARAKAILLWVHLHKLRQDCMANHKGNPDKLERPNKGELFGALGWPTTGRKAEDSSRWYEYAKAQKWVKAERAGGKPNGPLTHEIGTEKPADHEIALAHGGGIFVTTKTQAAAKAATNGNGGKS